MWLNVIIAAYYLYTLGWTKGAQCSVIHRICRQKPTWKKDILHYCVCSSVLIAMKYPHSFWCSAGRFTSFSCGLCHTEAQSVQIFVLIKPPRCSVQPGMCSWGQFNLTRRHITSMKSLQKKVYNKHVPAACRILLVFQTARSHGVHNKWKYQKKVSGSAPEEKGHLWFSYSNVQRGSKHVS